VESILERLLINANYDVDAAESGIIFVDEIDKKATRSSGITNTRDISGTGVQQALLKIAEGSNINVKLSARNGEVINMDTTNILFVFSGSFVGIEDIISARQHSSSHIGFTSDLDTGDHRDRSMRDVNIDDLTAYGIIPELVGRMPIIAVLDDLTQSDMITILRELHTSPVRQLQCLASQDGITLEFSDEFLESLSEAAVKHRLGGRSLRGLLDDVTTHVFYRIADFKKSQVVTVRFDKYLEPPTLVHQDGSENIDTAYKTYRGQNA
jgi:ATP-dependent Clp protease ATP-binding subunit ClpX